MDFEIDADLTLRKFREEVRVFVTQHEPSFCRVESRPGGEGKERSEIVRWTGILQAKGWLVPHWPLAWGGLGWSPIKRYVLDDELTARWCPSTDRIALDLVGPIICAYGSAGQRRKYLPAICKAEQFWCQGFSEPSAGSDVNALQTIARRDGNHYSVSGRKLWTTNAHFADMMFALLRVRAGSTVQTGLSFLLIDMHSPGVKVRPINTIDGRHHLNEVTLDEVRVPGENLIGEEGKGWVYARELLGKERPLVASVPYIKRHLEQLRGIAEHEVRGSGSLMEDPLFRARFARISVDLAALEFTVLRALSQAEDEALLDVLGPVLKIRGGDLRQRVSELAMEALGDRGMVMEQREGGAPEASWERDGVDPLTITRNFLFDRSATIAGGTSEVQRNIIAGIAIGV